MEFTLGEHTRLFEAELIKDARTRRDALGHTGAFDPEGWRRTVERGVLGLSSEGGTLLDSAVAFAAVAQGGLPGPLVEAELALATATGEVAASVRAGAVVTSVVPLSSPALVGWGAVAELVLDPRTGDVLCRGPLPEAKATVPLPHGWLDGVTPTLAVPAAEREYETRRAVLAAAALVGLGEGAVELARDHAAAREQFGRPLAAYQAMQLRLTESLLVLEGARLCVLDAAWRHAERRPHAAEAATMAYVNAAEASRIVERHVHQVHGALGFTLESGLPHLTWQAWWLRTSCRPHTVVDVLDHRDLTGPPPSVVLEGFRTGAVSLN